MTLLNFNVAMVLRAYNLIVTISYMPPNERVIVGIIYYYVYMRSFESQWIIFCNNEIFNQKIKSINQNYISQNHIFVVMIWLIKITYLCSDDFV